MTDVRTTLPTDRLTYPVKTTLYTDMDPTLVQTVLHFYKTASTPVEDGAGHKAFRTKTLKGILKDVEGIDTPDTPTVVASLKSFMNPSSTVKTMDVDADFALLFEGLTDTPDPSGDDTPDPS